MIDKKKTVESGKLVEIHKVWGPAEAEVIKSFLESHGIACILKGLVVQSVHPFSMDGLGEIKICVSEENAAMARKLLSAQIEKKE